MTRDIPSRLMGWTCWRRLPGGIHLEAYLTYASRIFDFMDAHKK